jgi:hypothetical protein
MPIDWPGGLVANVPEPAPPKIGRPHRDRKKVAASRRTARRNRRN